ncbi:hypothetical protein KsCSTR_38540 [Candidatus Kuenenia stuttgartiensis]|uniref:Uncharacterized protein n=2 Tax=Kuenenia stuttgartiensis TaxID=174633 RepID=Q1PUT4_KUEST|nr:hypothetical protein KsCSTR_38540 [Candidatus Kuenenia stuttgartiensis]CAJ70988.1 unknown protein [Candidatus Kuenenia stuttgartiensis]
MVFFLSREFFIKLKCYKKRSFYMVNILLSRRFTKGYEKCPFFRHLTVFSCQYYRRRKKEMAAREMCPFITTPPSNDCYCINADSLKIPSFLEYCTNNFQRCNFYITHLKKTHVSPAR